MSWTFYNIKKYEMKVNKLYTHAQYCTYSGKCVCISRGTNIYNHKTYIHYNIHMQVQMCSIKKGNITTKYILYYKHNFLYYFVRAMYELIYT